MPVPTWLLKSAVGLAFLSVSCGAVSAPQTPAGPPGPQILTSDVDAFFRVYDAAQGSPTAEALQRGYLDEGTDGLTQFAKLRDISGETLVKAIKKHPDIFSGARRCAVVLPEVRGRVGQALTKLGRLYPEARFPPVTVVIGRGATGGTTSAAGVLIGLETVCALDGSEANVADRFVHMIAHEYAHVQQPAAQTEDPSLSLLLQAEVEGGAEFVAELISGSVANRQLAVWAKGREMQIETAFVADEDRSDVSAWLYNGKPGAQDPSARPADLGYWVGYRIAKAYYEHARDKRAALRAILQVQDSHAYLAQSGWYPGIVLR